VLASWTLMQASVGTSLEPDIGDGVGEIAHQYLSPRRRVRCWGGPTHTFEEGSTARCLYRATLGR